MILLSNIFICMETVNISLNYFLTGSIVFSHCSWAQFSYQMFRKINWAVLSESTDALGQGGSLHEKKKDAESISVARHQPSPLYLFSLYTHIYTYPERHGPRRATCGRSRRLHQFDRQFGLRTDCRHSRIASCLVLSEECLPRWPIPHLFGTVSRILCTEIYALQKVQTAGQCCKVDRKGIYISRKEKRPSPRQTTTSVDRNLYIYRKSMIL